MTPRTLSRTRVEQVRALLPQHDDDAVNAYADDRLGFEERALLDCIFSHCGARHPGLGMTVGALHDLLGRGQIERQMVEARLASLERQGRLRFGELGRFYPILLPVED